MSINFHVNLSVNVADAVQAQANFGVPLLLAEHSVTANRQDGPFSSLAEVVAAGFTVAATPAINGWATRFFAQQPRSSQMLIGRRAAMEPVYTAMDAIEAVDPAAFYATAMETNTPNDILALATWTETRSKIAVVQSSSADMLAGTASTAQSSDITVGGTATDGNVYTIEVVNAFTGAVEATFSVTRTAGVPVDNDAIAAALAAGLSPLLTGVATVGSTAADVEFTFLGLGNGYTFNLTATGTGTLTESTPAFVQNPGELGAALSFDRTALLYHDDDTEFLDAALLARCLGFNLDAPAGAGVWSYHRFNGITATRLTTAQKTALAGYPVNWYSPVKFTSGVEDPGFSFPGQMLSGRFIDITTSVDVTQARMEEALLAVFTAAAATSRPKVPFTDAGIARFREAALDVFNRMVRAGHFAAGATSSATGRTTPYVDAPRAFEVSAVDKAARRLTMSGEAVFAGAINSVGDPATVGFNIDLSF